jgi:hypothetical protein
MSLLDATITHTFKESETKEWQSVEEKVLTIFAICHVHFNCIVE